MALPEFRANLQLTTSRQASGGSGFRAQASALQGMAQSFNRVNERTQDKMAEQAFQKGFSGELTEESLPASGSRVADAARKGFAANQAFATNLQISRKIEEITQNPDLTEADMAAALEASAQDMVETNIPEMSQSILQAFNSKGTAAISKVSRSRLVANKEAQIEGLIDIQTQLQDNYTVAFAENQVATDERLKLTEDLKAGRISQETYDDASLSIDDNAAVRLAEVQESLVEMVRQREDIDPNWTKTNSDALLLQLSEQARDEYLAQRISKTGDISELSQIKGLSVDERNKIASKVATFANLENNAEDRARTEETRQRNELFGRQLASLEIQMEEDPESVLRQVDLLEQINASTWGDNAFRENLAAMKESAQEIMASGGAANPVLFADLEYQIITGEAESIEDLRANNYSSLNREERQALQDKLLEIQDTKLTSPRYKEASSRIKLLLPDSSSKPSFAAQLRGVKIPPEQVAIEAARRKIAIALSDAVLSDDVVTAQQMNDFVQSQANRAKKEMPQFVEDKRQWDRTSLSLSTSQEDLRSYVKSIGGDAQKFKELKKMQDRLREFE